MSRYNATGWSGPRTIHALYRWGKSDNEHWRVHPSDSVLQPDLAMIVASSAPRWLWDLPTEFVTRKREMAVPDSAYYWHVDAQEIRRLTGMTKAEWPDKVASLDGAWKRQNGGAVMQLYHDSGDDGHTRYDLAGYLLVDALTLDMLVKERTEKDTWQDDYVFETPAQIAYEVAAKLEQTDEMSNRKWMTAQEIYDATDPTNKAAMHDAFRSAVAAGKVRIHKGNP